MSRPNLRTPWPIHFKFHRVIGIDGLKKVLVRLNFLVVQFFLYKNDKNQQTIISNLCKIFWLLSHKHYLILSLLIDIMIMTSLIKKINIQDKKSLVSNGSSIQPEM
jgi:hypothetical protein